jgi:threonylcarbamoyladenosine tRNA methylthiotransferase MtaB
MQTVSFHTLGCKLNLAETSTIGRQFIGRGFKVVDFGEQADVCVINTCSVTARADRECRQIIRRALRAPKRPFVVVTGCYAQLEPAEVASIEGVDLVLGSREKFEIFDHLDGLEKKLYPEVFVSDISSVDSFGPAASSEVGNRTRAFLKVQDGCDYNCSFCTIPLARGVSRSQGLEQCFTQARDLVRQGFKEIVLTGVNVGDYGRKTGTSLLALLESLSGIAGLERLRISSIEPNLLTSDIIRFVATTPVMCKHFHIPLQSGDDAILGLMRRRYTTARYAEVVHRIKEEVPDCGIGVDVIVGFPGEREEHFGNTCRFLSELPVSYLHVFTYSERPDTPAAAFANHVEPRVRFKRNEALRNIGARKRRVFHEHMLGRSLQVLLEGDVEGDHRLGFTDNYIRVAVPARGTEANSLVTVELVGIEGDRCMGRLVEREVAA